MKNRLMVEEDIEEVVEIEKKCFSVPWSEKEIRATFFREDSIYCVVEENGAVIGYAAFFFVLDEGNIINIGILPEFRGNKAGEGLVRFLLKEAAEKKLKKIYLEVRESNKPALGLYKKMGFVQTGERKDFYSDPRENGIVMTSTIC